MSEEEQLRAALEMSMQDAGGAGFAAVGMQAVAPSEAPRLPPSGRGRPRSFPVKDAQDVPTQPQRSSSAKKPRAEAQAGLPSDAHPSEPLELGADEIVALLRILFGDRPEAQDVERWFSVGFQFSPTPGTEWGLWQKHGGPCGVLAPVQGFLVKHLLFDGSEVNQEHPLAAQGDDVEDARASFLAHALAWILYSSTPLSSYVVCEVAPSQQGAAPDASAAAEQAAVAISTGGSANVSAAVSITGSRVARIADAQQLFEEGIGSWLAGNCGVLSFVCSVLLTRSLGSVGDDMDDPTNPLIGRFGHCSQELVNLMLIGEATSNVFDGSKWLGDDPMSGLLLKGVDSDRVGVPAVGLLSELEPMRYLSVGSLFKHPDFPIWVLSSPTHYTLLFSTRRSDSQLSEQAQLEQKTKQVFVANSIDDGCLALAGSLGRLVEGLGLGEDKMRQAQAELVSEEVILWEDFRQWANRQFGVSDSPAEPGARDLTLFLYDGQDPPGPTLRSVSLELNDIDPLLAGGSDGDAFAATLHTRWPNAIVDVKAIAGAGAGPRAGNGAPVAAPAALGAEGGADCTDEAAMHGSG